METIILVSSLCKKETYNRLILKDFRMGQQNQKYVRLICEGLNDNGVNVISISVPPVNSHNCRLRVVAPKDERDRTTQFFYTRLINIPVFRNLSMFFSVFLKTIKLCRKEKANAVIVDLLNVTSSAAAILGARLAKKKVFGFLTDMPMIYVGNENKKVTCQQRFSQKISEKWPDGYLFISNEMNRVVNKKQKAFLVLEGFSDFNMRLRESSLDNKVYPKVCLYAGGINKLYGLDMLVNGFIKADLPECVLKIFGDGPYVTELKEICKTNKNILYLGVSDNNDIIEEEEKAFLLINPRYTTSEYTKYSFPSKNLEYMSSGTAVLTTKLPSMPSEYFEYVFLLEKETVEGMADTLRGIFKLSEKELFEKGAKAKEWVIVNKNNVAAMKRLIETIREVVKE